MADDVRKVVGSLLAYAARVSRDLALEINANLIEATPVDTGWARANWIPTTSEPSIDPVGAPDAAGGEQASAVAAMATRTPVLDRYFVANGVPYIQSLNSGSSTQAPAAFVQAAIAAAKATVGGRK